MNNKMLGAVLIFIGLALAVWGYGIYSSFGSELGRTLSGDTPIEAWLGMLGGAICFVVGAAKFK